jgi:2-oxoisovalerate dehydrogenase E2 component (dihydrolipoyl transacylase)
LTFVYRYSTYLDVTALHTMLPILSETIPPKFLPAEATLSSPQTVSQTAIFGNNYKPPHTRSDPLTHYTKLTLLPLLLKALSKAMMEWPVFRSSIASSTPKPTVSIRSQANICIALSTPSGLYSPTIQHVDAMSAFEIMGELRRLSNLGRRTPNHGLGPRELPKNGGTITVSNVGAIGKGEFASPVLVPGGGVAIVALGRAQWVNELDEDMLGLDVVKDESETVVGRRKLRMGVSWSADHRVVEGAELASFMECWRSWVENPMRLIGEGR